MGAYFLKKQARSPILEGFGRNIYALLSFSGQQYFEVMWKHEVVDSFTHVHLKQVRRFDELLSLF